MSIIKDINLAPSGEMKINWVERNMPVLRGIGRRFSEEKPFKGLKVALSVHLEAKTAYLCRVMEMGGAEMYVTGSNPLSTQDDVAAALAAGGMNVFAEYGCTEQQYEDCLREVVDAVSAELPKIKGAAETADKKGWTEMTQEKYKKVAAAMRTALVSIFGNYADVEDRLRTADAEIQSVLLNERICARPASYPIEGIAVEAEKLETENEPDEGESEAKKLTRAAVLEKARACVCGEREEDYGSPEDSFGCIAELWETYLRAACVSPDAIVTVTPTDVAMMMALLKIARVGTSPVGGTADSFVDLAGYAACGAECAEVTV